VLPQVRALGDLTKTLACGERASRAERLRLEGVENFCVCKGGGFAAGRHLICADVCRDYGRECEGRRATGRASDGTLLREITVSEGCTSQLAVGGAGTPRFDSIRLTCTCSGTPTTPS
jgi:hypothetical protein